MPAEMDAGRGIPRGDHTHKPVVAGHLGLSPVLSRLEDKSETDALLMTNTMNTDRPIRRTRLKGGSLSGTYLLEVGGESRIRKEIALSENREYGFVRWHSQLKRLQRFGQMFPGVFPAVLDVGREGDRAYFDLEFIAGSVSGFTFLLSDPAAEKIQAYFDAVVRTMDQLHSVRRPSYHKALDLYLYEEMERPLTICAQDSGFRAFLKHETVVFNGTEVPSLVSVLPRLYEVGEQHYRSPFECYTHGNLTLENTLWVPDQGRVWFVDPYEENIADTVHNEYSQILQSCHSLYEIYNELDPDVTENRITLNAPAHPGVDGFNQLFDDWLHARLKADDLRIVRLYEVSQFTRMLPFKLHVAKEKMVFFYALASVLAARLLEESHV